jgi:hypothetical protein
MSPTKKCAAVQWGANSRGFKQTSMLTYMSTFNQSNSSTSTVINDTFVPITSENTKNVKTRKNNCLTQQSIIYFLTPPNSRLSTTAPQRPTKPNKNNKSLPSVINLEVTIFQHEPSLDGPPKSSHSPNWQQSKINAFFHPLPRPPPQQPERPPAVSLEEQPSSPHDSTKGLVPRAVRRALLWYSAKQAKSINRIHRYTLSMPT